MEALGTDTHFPRETIKSAFQLIHDTYVVQIRQLILDLEGKADEPTS